MMILKAMYSSEEKICLQQPQESTNQASEAVSFAAVFALDCRRRALTFSRSSRSRSCVDVSFAEEWGC